MNNLETIARLVKERGFALHHAGDCDRKRKLVVLAQTYNEERFIGRYLEEAGKIADGIVLFDDGSTDRTVELAVHPKLFLVVRREKNKGFNDLENRNFLLSIAESLPSEWFLFLDADEVVEGSYHRKFEKLLQRKDVDVVELRIAQLWNDEQHFRTDIPDSQDGIRYTPKLFRKRRGMRMLSDRQLHFKLAPYTTNRIGKTEVLILHYGNIDAERRRMRYERYCREDPGRIYQPSYEHLLAENAVTRPLSDLYGEKRRFKVLYFISSSGHGKGGHLHDLRVLAKILTGEGIVPVVVVLWTGVRPAQFDGMTYQARFWEMNNAKAVKRSLSEIDLFVRNERPDAVHSFDNPSLFFSLYASRRHHIPLVHTKPGGVNDYFFPKIPYLITYSEENRRYFANQRKFRGTEISLIPQRMGEIDSDVVRIRELKKKLKLGKGPVFLRITRLAHFYRQSIMKCARLVERLCADGISAHLLVIGTPDDAEVVEEVKRCESEAVHIITDPEFTHEANDLIDIADYVVGVGNSLHAGAARGKVLLTTPPMTQYPVPITERNFSDLFYYNFRCTFEPDSPLVLDDEEEAYLLLRRVMKDGRLRAKYQRFSRSLFEKYFDITLAREFYKDFYRQLKYRAPTGLVDCYWRTRYTLIAFNRDAARFPMRDWRFEWLALALAMRLFVSPLTGRLKGHF